VYPSGFVAVLASALQAALPRPLEFATNSKVMTRHGTLVADRPMSVTMALCASCAEDYDNLDGLVAVEDAFGFRVEADEGVTTSDDAVLPGCGVRQRAHLVATTSCSRRASCSRRTRPRKGTGRRSGGARRVFGAQ
jgi:hypothetical protein